MKLERAMGIEPTSGAWKAPILPLNYARQMDFPFPKGRPAKRPGKGSPPLGNAEGGLSGPWPPSGSDVPQGKAPSGRNRDPRASGGADSGTTDRPQ